MFARKSKLTTDPAPATRVSPFADRIGRLSAALTPPSPLATVRLAEADVASARERRADAHDRLQNIIARQQQRPDGGPRSIDAELQAAQADLAAADAAVNAARTRLAELRAERVEPVYVAQLTAASPEFAALVGEIADDLDAVIAPLAAFLAAAERAGTPRDGWAARLRTMRTALAELRRAAAGGR